MNNPPDQPKHYDAILGGEQLPPEDGVVLGGVEAIKWSASLRQEAALAEQDMGSLKGDLKGLHLTNANLRGACLSNDDLSEAFLRNADLSGSNLNDVILNNANLQGANLSFTQMQRVNLTNSNLVDANLTSADLSNANLTHANFNGANLSLANLSNSNLSHANFCGVKNLTSQQVKSASGWQKAKYDHHFFEKL